MGTNAKNNVTRRNVLWLLGAAVPLGLGLGARLASAHESGANNGDRRRGQGYHYDDDDGHHYGRGYRHDDGDMGYHGGPMQQHMNGGYGPHHDGRGWQGQQQGKRS